MSYFSQNCVVVKIFLKFEKKILLIWLWSKIKESEFTNKICKYTIRFVKEDWFYSYHILFFDCTKIVSFTIIIIPHNVRCNYKYVLIYNYKNIIEYKCIVVRYIIMDKSTVIFELFTKKFFSWNLSNCKKKKEMKKYLRNTVKNYIYFLLKIKKIEKYKIRIYSKNFIADLQVLWQYILLQVLMTIYL